MLSARFLGLRTFNGLLPVGLDLKHQIMVWHSDSLAVSPEAQKPSGLAHTHRLTGDEHGLCIVEVLLKAHATIARSSFREISTAAHELWFACVQLNSVGGIDSNIGKLFFPIQSIV